MTTNRAGKVAANIAQEFSRQDVLEKAQTFFEPQLAAIELGKSQIQNQTLEQLEQSLERVNDAIRSPGSFGTLKLQLSAGVGMFVATSGVDFHLEIGILPVLLERKKLILDRIRLLKGDQKIEELESLVKDIPNEDVRNKIEREVQELKYESQKLREQADAVEQAQLQSQLNSEVELAKAQSQLTMAKLSIEGFERRSKVWQSFLARESVATIVGSLLLTVIVICLLVAMFINVTTTEIINNGFLVLLGYFFGQTTSTSRKGDETNIN